MTDAQEADDLPAETQAEAQTENAEPAAETVAEAEDAEPATEIVAKPVEEEAEAEPSDAAKADAEAQTPNPVEAKEEQEADEAAAPTTDDAEVAPTEAKSEEQPAAKDDEPAEEAPASQEVVEEPSSAEAEAAEQPPTAGEAPAEAADTAAAEQPAPTDEESTPTAPAEEPESATETAKPDGQEEQAAAEDTPAPEEVAVEAPAGGEAEGEQKPAADEAAAVVVEEEQKEPADGEPAVAAAGGETSVEVEAEAAAADDAAAEESKEAVVEDKKDEAVEETKVEPAEEAKDEPVEEAKDEPVEEAKDEPAEEAKDELAEEAKDESTEAAEVVPVEEAKDEAPEETKDAPAESEVEAAAETQEAAEEDKDQAAEAAEDEPVAEAKDEPAEEVKEEAADAAKDETVEVAKDETADESKDDPVDEAKDEPVEEAKDEPVEEAKDEPVEEAKDEVVESKDVPAETEAAAAEAETGAGEQPKSEPADDQPEADAAGGDVEEPSVEESQDKPAEEAPPTEQVADDKEDGPAVAGNTEEAAVEESKEEPAAEENKEQAVVEDAKDEPVVEESKDEPVVEESKDEPAVEETKDEPSTEETKDEPAVEEAKVEDAAEEAKEEPAVDNKEEPPVEETKEDPAGEEAKEEPAAESKDEEVSDDDAETDKEMPTIEEESQEQPAANDVTEEGAKASTGEEHPALLDTPGDDVREVSAGISGPTDGDLRDVDTAPDHTTTDLSGVIVEDAVPDEPQQDSEIATAADEVGDSTADEPAALESQSAELVQPQELTAEDDGQVPAKCVAQAEAEEPLSAMEAVPEISDAATPEPPTEHPPQDAGSTEASSQDAEPEKISESPASVEEAAHVDQAEQEVEPAVTAEEDSTNPEDQVVEATTSALDSPVTLEAEAPADVVGNTNGDDLGPSSDPAHQEATGGEVAVTTGLKEVDVEEPSTQTEEGLEKSVGDQATGEPSEDLPTEPVSDTLATEPSVAPQEDQPPHEAGPDVDSPGALVPAEDSKLESTETGSLQPVVDVADSTVEESSIQEPQDAAAAEELPQSTGDTQIQRELPVEDQNPEVAQGPAEEIQGDTASTESENPISEPQPEAVPAASSDSAELEVLPAATSDEQPPLETVTATEDLSTTADVSLDEPVLSEEVHVEDLPVTDAAASEVDEPTEESILPSETQEAPVAQTAADKEAAVPSPNDDAEGSVQPEPVSKQHTDDESTHQDAPDLPIEAAIEEEEDGDLAPLSHQEPTVEAPQAIEASSDKEVHDVPEEESSSSPADDVPAETTALEATAELDDIEKPTTESEDSEKPSVIQESEDAGAATTSEETPSNVETDASIQISEPVVDETIVPAAEPESPILEPQTSQDVTQDHSDDVGASVQAEEDVVLAETLTSEAPAVETSPEICQEQGEDESPAVDGLEQSDPHASSSATHQDIDEQAPAGRSEAADPVTTADASLAVDTPLVAPANPDEAEDSTGDIAPDTVVLDIQEVELSHSAVVDDGEHSLEKTDTEESLDTSEATPLEVAEDNEPALDNERGLSDQAPEPPKSAEVAVDAVAVESEPVAIQGAEDIVKQDGEAIDDYVMVEPDSVAQAPSDAEVVPSASVDNPVLEAENIEEFVPAVEESGPTVEESEPAPVDDISEKVDLDDQQAISSEQLLAEPNLTEDVAIPEVVAQASGDDETQDAPTVHDQPASEPEPVSGEVVSTDDIAESHLVAPSLESEDKSALVPEVIEIVQESPQEADGPREIATESDDKANEGDINDQPAEDSGSNAEALAVPTATSEEDQPVATENTSEEPASSDTEGQAIIQGEKPATIPNSQDLTAPVAETDALEAQEPSDTTPLNISEEETAEAVLAEPESDATADELKPAPDHGEVEAIPTASEEQVSAGIEEHAPHETTAAEPTETVSEPAQQDVPAAEEESKPETHPAEESIVLVEAPVISQSVAEAAGPEAVDLGGIVTNRAVAGPVAVEVPEEVEEGVTQPSVEEVVPEPSPETDLGDAVASLSSIAQSRGVVPSPGESAAPTIPQEQTTVEDTPAPHSPTAEVRSLSSADMEYSQIEDNIPLSESFHKIEKEPVTNDEAIVVEQGTAEDHSEKGKEPIVVSVREGTQTDDAFLDPRHDYGTLQPGISTTDLFRAPTPAVVIPDLDDPLAKQLSRARSLRKQRRNTIKKAEEVVAAAVVIYATADALSAPNSPPRLASPPNEATDRAPKTLNSEAVAAREESEVTPAAPVREVVPAGGEAGGSRGRTRTRSIGPEQEDALRSSVADLFLDDAGKDKAKDAPQATATAAAAAATTKVDERNREASTPASPKRPSNRSSRRHSSHRDRDVSNGKDSPRRGHRHRSGSGDAGGDRDESRTSSSHSKRRRRTPEEQAAHEKRKEERRLAREREEQQDKGKGRDGPSSSSSPSKDKGKERATSSASKASGSRERSSDHHHHRGSGSRRHSRTAGDGKEAETTPPPPKKFFDMKNGQSVLESNFAPKDATATANGGGAGSKSVELKRSATARSSRRRSEDVSSSGGGATKAKLQRAREEVAARVKEAVREAREAASGSGSGSGGESGSSGAEAGPASGQRRSKRLERREKAAKDEKKTGFRAAIKRFFT